MFEPIPWIPILVVAVVIQFGWSWWCCKKARQAYKAAEKLYAWVESAHPALVCVVNDHHPGCKPTGSGPGWPPPDVGDFPPEA